MTLQFYSTGGSCKAKAMSKFRAMEERFDSLRKCCRAKFPNSLSDCCSAKDSDCLSGKIKFIPVRICVFLNFVFFPSYFTFFFTYFTYQKWQDQICYTKDENLLADWERAFAKTTLRECCEHNIHYDVNSCCKNSEGNC